MMLSLRKAAYLEIKFKGVSLSVYSVSKEKKRKSQEDPIG